MHSEEVENHAAQFGTVPAELRELTANVLADRTDIIARETVASFPFSGPQQLEADFCLTLGSAFVRMLSEAVRSGGLDARGGSVDNFYSVAAQRTLTPEQIFSFSYLALSSAIDELAPNPRLGTSTEAWPQVSQCIRRGVFDVISAWTSRVVDAAITDPLTTLNSRSVFEIAFRKECHRAERFEHWLSLIVLEVDNLPEISRTHGYGVGERLLERLGILLRSYFRQVDWVARYSDGAFAILLPETTPENARLLAERAALMVQERLTFRDHRTDRRAPVTVSVALVSARALIGEPIEGKRLLGEAERALERAKSSARSRVEQVELQPRLMSIDEAALLLNTNLAGIEKLVEDGHLDPINAGPHVRLEREAVEQLVDRIN